MQVMLNLIERIDNGKVQPTQPQYISFINLLARNIITLQDYLDKDRYLVKQGPVSLIVNRERRPVHLFLFNDMMVQPHIITVVLVLMRLQHLFLYNISVSIDICETKV